MKKIVILLAFLIVVFPMNVNANENNKIEVVTLSKCVDANSARFMLGTSEIKVRFIAIESSDKILSEYTDEINGSTVDEYVCSALTNANEIKIEYEKNSEEVDKYGRTLAWIFVDDVLLQENLVKLGYSKVAYLYDTYTYSEEIKKAEQYAKDNELGMWKVETVDTNANVEEEPEKVEDDSIITKLVTFINEIFEKFLDFIDKLISDVL